jgi:hypothetical protein
MILLSEINFLPFISYVIGKPALIAISGRLKLKVRAIHWPLKGKYLKCCMEEIPLLSVTERVQRSKDFSFPQYRQHPVGLSILLISRKSYIADRVERNAF